MKLKEIKKGMLVRWHPAKRDKTLARGVVTKLGPRARVQVLLQEVLIPDAVKPAKRGQRLMIPVDALLRDTQREDEIAKEAARKEAEKLEHEKLMKERIAEKAAKREAEAKAEADSAE